MRYLLFCICAFILLPLHANVREEMDLEKGWKFTKGDVAEAMQPDYNDSKWQSVTVPHDWAIAGPFDRNIDIQYVVIVHTCAALPSVLPGRTGHLPIVGEGCDLLA